MSLDLENLYSLLPAIYRVRDAEQARDGGHAEELKALLDVIAEQAAVLEENLAQLYDDQFIETCAEWVVPYVGDALGVHPLSAGGETAAYSLRAYVANTLAYRRRKGTASVLEQLARDVSGWPARAVEFFQLLATTQHLAHLRSAATTVNLRAADRLDLLDTPFDTLAHTGEVRRIASRRGKYNIPHVGIFLWRLGAYLMSHAPASGADGLYRFSPLGHDMPLFHQPLTETEMTHLAEEADVPGPIRPRGLAADLTGYWDRFSGEAGEDQPQHSRYYGPDRSLAVYRDGELVPPLDLVVADLEPWEKPRPGKVAIDPRRGRLAFAEHETPAHVAVSYSYGFSADMGGGPYDRQATLDPAPPETTLLVPVSKSGTIKTLQHALRQWDPIARPRCVIRIGDNGIYGGVINVTLGPHTALIIEAADGFRPIWRAPSPIGVTGQEDATFALNGILVEGSLTLHGDVTCSLSHCTLVPGSGLNKDGTARLPMADGLRAAAGSHPQITVADSIVGPIRLHADAGLLVLRDSIVDAPPPKGSGNPAVAAYAIAANDTGTAPGPAVTLERCTIFGRSHVRQVEATDVIFADLLHVERRQAGWLRFCYAPPGSVTPRRYRCQPDLALAAYAAAAGKTAQGLTAAEAAREAAQVRPQFTVRRYGAPAYAQLSMACSAAIKAGGEDGAEVGAFNRLKQPQREANLQAALREYLRFGLETGIFWVS